MLLDICDVEDVPPESDLCIVGAGAAGLTLAAALMDRHLQIVMLEAGGRRFSAAAQADFQGEVCGAHPPAHEFRVRAFGGSSIKWGGGCVPLNRIDFAERDWCPAPGWPLTYEDIRAYYGEAMCAAEAGRCDFDAPSPLIAGIDGETFRTSLERFSRPTNFAKRWQKALACSSAVRIVLNAPVVDIRLAAGGAQVDHVVVAAPEDRRIRIRSRRFVLAMGGIETARLLLASDKDNIAGIGNHSGWVGRGYMCHTAGICGIAALAGPPEATQIPYDRDRDGVYFRRRLLLTEDAQRKNRLLNMAFRLRPQDPSDPAHGDGVLSALHLARTHLPHPTDQVLPRRQRVRRDVSAHLANVAREPLAVAGAAATLFAERYLGTRKPPPVSRRSRNNRYAVEFHAEQAPNRDSRIRLSAAKDSLGLPRISIDWRTLPIDIDTVKAGYAMLAERLVQVGAGRLEYCDEELEDIGRSVGAYGGHHIGTTRMSARPEDGVVGSDCAVFGLSNLFIAGAAVMPTCGQANPTLTVLAIALRLAEHLAG